MKMEILSGVFYFGGARLAAFGVFGFYSIMSRHVSICLICLMSPKLPCFVCKRDPYSLPIYDWLQLHDRSSAANFSRQKAR